MWDIAKAVVKRKFIAMCVYIKKFNKISNNLMMHLKVLEKQEQTKLKAW
jgi:hypothetical protein